MDLMTVSLAGLVAIGATNVVTFFKPGLDSKVKFAISFVVAFLVLFVPVELGNQLLDQARMALEVAIATSGAYKLFQVVGTKK